MRTNVRTVSLLLTGLALSAARALDFGDAPAPFPTTLADDGARHGFPAIVWLGANNSDNESDGLPDAQAQGDDLNGIDDEDGVVFPPSLPVGSVATALVTASGASLLNAWIDFDGDGAWTGAAEQVASDVALTGGINAVVFTVPVATVAGTLQARFRVSSGGGLGFTGEAPDGEVEDYALEAAGAGYDYGDAPSGFPVAQANLGARHALPAGVWLGSLAPDAELDGQASAGADADDLAGGDDEDGLVAPLLLRVGTTTSLTVVASGAGVLDAWVDFNGDGSWDDAGEHFASNVVLAAGAQAVDFTIPAQAQPGARAARFRITTAGFAFPLGTAPDGEVEDHLLLLNGFDWGDAPTGYPVRAAQNGAHHTPSALWLGSAGPDAEADGQPAAAADGDDLAGDDDEDGITLAGRLQPGGTGTLTVVASSAGLLQAWLDYNGNHSWLDADEQIATNLALVAGPQEITFAVPGTLAATSVVARFRLASEPDLPPTGPAADGEVEDHRLPVAGWDFGDAPTSFPVTVAADGARHRTGGAIWLGGAPDEEAEGQPGPAAAGDDLTGLDDEDGIVFPAIWLAGGTGLVQVTASTDCWLQVWVDFDHNGVWTGAEQVVADHALTGGVQTLEIPVPLGAAQTALATRFRVSSQTGLGPAGAAPDGEVEDHLVQVLGGTEDYGDAPTNYPVTVARDGARHTLPTAVWLGLLAPDGEPDGVPGPTADGDDTSGMDDEDGVLLPPTAPVDSVVTAAVTVTGSGILNAWVDFNGDGDWSGPGEQVVAELAVTAGVHALTWYVPANAVPGAAAARFRIDSAGGLGAGGLAADGEVEDHMLALTGLDFGDALTGYPVTLADDGARHLLPTTRWLGTAPDAESDGQPFNGIGDDINGRDDEDGVTWTLPLVGGRTSTVTVTASGAGRLSVWVDFDGNSSWGEVGDQAVADQVLTAGVNHILFPVPALVATGAAQARVRFSGTTGLSFTGMAADGEVEDYVVTLADPPANVDYGDAPPGFPVSAAQDGARHQMDDTLWLGTAVDDEPDGIPSAGADADDTGGTDDEDGVTLATAYALQDPGTVTVIASASGVLDAWVDFNRDGDWADAGEQIADSIALSAGPNEIVFTPSGPAVAGLAAARFRISSAGGLDPSGLAPDGEVEDHLLQLGEVTELDFGDAPATFPVTLAQDGARHRLPSALYLGAGVDAESNGTASAAAEADDLLDTDDEDGVNFSGLWQVNGTGTASVVASAAGLLSAWFDFDRDGSWSLGERILLDVPVSAGVNNLDIPIPPGATPGAVDVRFRVSTAGGFGLTGEAADGEVEDHQVTVLASSTDFGDAPTGFPVTVAQDGARHSLPTLVWLGTAAPDGELDGQPGAAAAGDDTAGTDDEDGVVLPAYLPAGGQATALVTVAGSGFLNAWLDINGDGAWSSLDEHIADDTAVTSGVHALLIALPAQAAPGLRALRVRVSSSGGLAPTGAAADGEVEDLLALITALDYGDAPAPLPVLLADDGARHRLPSARWLGGAPDEEADGQPAAGATGDDLNGADDEDGVAWSPTLTGGSTATVTVTASTSGWCAIWVDFNRNQSWGDPGEQAVTDAALTAGVNRLSFGVPAGVSTGSAAARVRFSGTTGLGFVGPADDGEVEDDLVVLQAAPPVLDFGDAPAGFPVTLLDNGARHTTGGALHLGATVDAEADGLPAAGADGDDLADADDEDGVALAAFYPLMGVATATVTLSASGQLDAWMDFNRDGTWDDEGEQIASNLSLTAGPHDLLITPPVIAQAGQAAARFRVSSAGSLPPTGPAADGEVEDYLVQLDAPTLYDFGDAPAPYPVQLADEGARHAQPSPLFLGAAVDAEADGQPSAGANGDDVTGTADEEGVFWTGALVRGETTNIIVTASSGGLLGLWLDLDHDGSWAGPGEQLIADLAVAAGATPIGLTIPLTALPGPTYARLRLSSTPGLASTGAAANGEVEDYAVMIFQRAATNAIAFTNLTRVGESIAIGVAASGPAVYQAQVVSDLRPGATWTNWGALLPGPLTGLTDTNPAPATRFYRLVVPFTP